MHFDPVTQTFSGSPAQGDDGVIGVKVTATDHSNAQVSTNFNLDVVAHNQAPVITTVTHNPDHSSGQIHATDTDQLQYSAKHEGNHKYGDLTVNPDGSFHYVPNGNTDGMATNSGHGGWHHFGGGHEGKDTFIVDVTDSHGEKTSKYLTFDVHTDYNGHHAIVTGASDSDPALAVSNDEPEQVEHTDTVDVNVQGDDTDANHDSISDAHSIHDVAESGEFNFDLGNAAAMLDDAKADKAIADTAEALQKVAGLLEEHPDSVEASLVHHVENAPIKEPVPSEHAIHQAEHPDSATDDATSHDHSIDHTEYAPPHHSTDDDDHHDGSGLT